MFCENCGNVIQEGAAFCVRCGSAAANPNNAARNPDSTAAYASMPVQKANPAGRKSSAPHIRYKTGLIAFALAATAAAVAVVALFFVIMTAGKRDGNPSKAEEAINDGEKSTEASAGQTDMIDASDHEPSSDVPPPEREANIAPSADASTAKLYLYNSMASAADENAGMLKGASVIVRKGWNVRDGETVAEGAINDGGFFEASLAPGEYTAEYSIEGYAPTWENFTLSESGGTVKAYTVPMMTAEIALDMYRQFLLGNTAAEFEGRQMTYGELRKQYCDEIYPSGVDEDYFIESSPQFALTDYDYDNIPELHIRLGLDLMVQFYSVTSENGTLKLTRGAEGNEDCSPPTLFDNGIIRVSRYNTMEEFTGYYSWQDVENCRMEDTDKRNPIAKFDAWPIHAEDAELERMEAFEREYCGSEVPFFYITEDSINANLVWH